MSTEIIISQWLYLVQGLNAKTLSLASWFLIAMFTMAPLENFFYLRRQPLFREDFFTDTLYFFISSILPMFVLVVTNGLVMWFFRHTLPDQWFTFMQATPVWLRIIAVVATGDFGYYWAHRWAHEIPFFWRFHSIHHSPQQIDWLVATRVHPLDIVFVRGVSFIPVFGLGLLDMSGANIYSLLLVTFNNIWGIFIHANVKFRFGWLEYVLTTPYFHHWHHANDNPAVVNKNYAALLPIYDRLFGSLYLPKNAYPCRYGISTYLPDSFFKQLVYPFVWLLGKKQD